MEPLCWGANPSSGDGVADVLSQGGVTAPDVVTDAGDAEVTAVVFSTSCYCSAFCIGTFPPPHSLPKDKPPAHLVIADQVA